MSFFAVDPMMLPVTIKYEKVLADGTTEDVKYPAFANLTADPDPVEVQLSAVKTLDGQAPSNVIFDFTLMRDGKLVDTAVNDTDGNISFSKFTFTETGTYSYIMSEVAGSDEGIIYDATEYTVTITVTEAEGNKLAAAVAITKDGQPYEGIPAFANESDPELPGTGDDPEDPEIPATGDSSSPWILLSIACAGFAGMLLAIRKVRHN